MNPPDLSALVPSYNRAENLKRFLPPLVIALDGLRREGVDSELIVVDNGSHDGSAAAAREASPGATVIRLRPNRGASGARNAAARAASGRWLLLCDDDVEMTSDALRSLWQARRPGICLVPEVRDLRGVLQNAVVARWRFGDHKLYEVPEPIPKVAYPMSACILVEQDLYWSVGGFDERYQPQCYEDPAFGFSLRAQGATIQMVSGVVVTHHVHGGPTAEDQQEKVRQHRERYRKLTYKNRWLFALLVLSGWRRWMVVSLGLPRTLFESVRTRSLGPLVGYGQAWLIFASDPRRQSTRPT